MPGYHIRPNLTIGICNAPEGKCPFGEDEPHFDTVEEAEKYRDSQKKNQILPENISLIKQKTESVFMVDLREKINILNEEKKAKLKAVEIEYKTKIDALMNTSERWHITVSNKVQPCIAEPGNCIFGDDNEHFNTEKEAEKYKDDQS